MDETLGYLHSLRGKGSKLGLGRMRSLLQAMDHPERGFGSVLVGGSSGKGSTCAMLSSILKQAGYRTGLYTSPHLSSIKERIKVDGQDIDDEGFSRAIAHVRQAIERSGISPQDAHPTFFEVLSAAALWHFRRMGVGIAVLEVGLGGRLDATNAVEPELSIISGISLEHTQILGDSLELIAREKAGIVRAGGMLITGARGPALREIGSICARAGSGMRVLGRDFSLERTSYDENGSVVDFRSSGRSISGLRIPLMGGHQASNAALAIEAALRLEDRGSRIGQEAIGKGLAATIWPGRMEIVRREPPLMLDCAKDPDAMNRLRDALQELGWKELTVVIALSSDKDVRGMVEGIAPVAGRFIATVHCVEDRRMDPEAIAREAARLGRPCSIATDMGRALEDALAHARARRGKALVAGSVFAVGQARDILLGKVPGPGRELNEVLRP